MDISILFEFEFLVIGITYEYWKFSSQNIIKSIYIDE